MEIIKPCGVTLQLGPWLSHLLGRVCRVKRGEASLVQHCQSNYSASPITLLVEHNLIAASELTLNLAPVLKTDGTFPIALWGY